MKATKTLAAAFVIISMGSAVAGSHEEPGGLFRQSMMADDLMASRLIGMRVHAGETDVSADASVSDNSELEDVGEINDLIVKRDGTVEAVLVDIGGFLGMGERQVAIGMSSLEFRDDQETDEVGDFLLVIPASQEMLESAPEYDVSSMDAISVANNDLQPPAEVMQSVDVVPMDSSPRATGVTEAITMGEYVPIPIELVTGEQLTGARVYTGSDDDIGEVSGLLLDGDTVSRVVIDVGGFLGIGEKPVALDMADLEVMQYPNEGEVRVRVQMDKEQLEALPEYE
ncbi:PRC-barrel domain-containing protein [Granulosicoccus antarcticus]|uniref:PRC-barrel domain-containing protein n=1 Tax=Granulosicoccus antarcticus IMCC3135 TaxID=1192854 RepID=A0A2Z2NTW7_9GAMM|nr:PRC-barrel domain-containing protein [Granulosicoccus antarcticus]ASJ71077.1 hypothetical protein IMCC3135_04820 [Granulosicoccus antarcticus IMCC3135]